jgi:hypothetical protein
MAVMEFTYEGREFILDLEDMDTDQARAMERYGVPNLKTLTEGILNGDLKALTVLYWLALIQDGEEGTRLEKVRIKPVKLLMALTAKKSEGSNPEDDELGKDEQTE